MPDYKNEPEGIKNWCPGLTWYSRDAGSNPKVEVGVFYFNYSWIPYGKIAIILLSVYGKNLTFYFETREDAGFFAVTSGSAAQSSIIDDFATLPLIEALQF